MRSFFSKIPTITLISIIITIGILSLLPPESGFELKKDKLGHFLAYAALSANTLYFNRGKKSFIILLLSVWGYGLLLEMLQSLIPGRETSFFDLLANISGSLIGVIVHFIFTKKLKKIFHHA